MYMIILFVVKYLFDVWMSDILKVGGSICSNSFLNPHLSCHSSLPIFLSNILSFCHPLYFFFCLFVISSLCLSIIQWRPPSLVALVGTCCSVPAVFGLRPVDSPAPPFHHHGHSSSLDLRLMAVVPSGWLQHLSFSSSQTFSPWESGKAIKVLC